MEDNKSSETQSNNSSSSKTFEIRKMGCSFLRQCRRRTQSEPPRKINREKLKKAKNKSSRYSIRNADEVDVSRRKESHFPEEGTENKHKEENDIENEPKQNTSEQYETCSRCDHQQNCIKHDDEGGGGSVRIEEPSCLSFICCRKNRKNSLSYKNNNVYPYTLEQYLKVADSEVSSTVDSRSTCFSSLNTEQSSQCATLTSSSEQSRVFGSENSSSANLSHDSGFDEPQCFINMIYENHRCKGYYSCHKKDKASLNIHLKNLMNCMPKSFGEKEDDPGQPMRTFKGASLSKRRNAICETSNEARKKFYDALCAFMTLQAMAKYDFL